MRGPRSGRLTGWCVTNKRNHGWPATDLEIARETGDMIEELRDLYPTLMRLVDTPSLMADLEKTKGCMGAAEPVDCIHEKRVKKAFHTGLLTYHLAAAWSREGWFDPLVPLIEADLKKLKPRVGKLDDLVAAFRRKLLNDAEFDDVVYEIAAATIFSDVFDGNGISLEEPLNTSTKKNPDVTGSWNGRRTRAEVTVVHDDWPPAYSQQAQEIIESASVPGGYTGTLNVPLTDRTDAVGIRRLIEELFAVRMTTAPTVNVDSYVFSHRDNEFRSNSIVCPIQYLEFYDSDFRDVQGSCVERSTITRLESSELNEQFPKPVGMKTTADLKKNPSAYSDSPIGEKIYRTLETKKRRC
jgi:hypothetical protein